MWTSRMQEAWPMMGLSTNVDSQENPSHFLDLGNALGIVWQS